MPRYWIFILIIGMLAFSGCSNNETEQNFSGTTKKIAQEDINNGQMTDIAKELGITAENYPEIDGSTSTLPIVQAIWRAMYGEDKAYGENYPKKASKTVPSYQLLIDGEVDLILVPYASREVLETAKQSGVELEFYKIAAEALIFITAAENPADNITYEQVQSIYLNYDINDWGEMGGSPERELVPICRNSDSGSQSQMDNLILQNQPMHPDIKKNFVELTMEGMLEQVAFYHNGGIAGKPSHSYALGYTLYTYLQNMNEITGIGEWLKILNYEGIEPAMDSIADESYTLSDGYYAVLRKDLAADHSARNIIKWLQSDNGTAAIKSLGLAPVVNK